MQVFIEKEQGLCHEGRAKRPTRGGLSRISMAKIEHAHNLCVKHCLCEKEKGLMGMLK
jgi:hypothetical protein